MAKRTRLSVLMLVGGCPLLLFGQGRLFKFDASADGKASSGYLSTWDTSHDRLILRRDVDTPQSKGIRVHTKDGQGIAFQPLEGISGAEYLSVWGASGTSEGGVVVAGVVGYGPRREGRRAPLKAAVLTYDHSGRLVRFWDVRPYHHHFVVSLDDGSVFALGDRDDTSSSYPMLIEYSPSGEVLGQALYSGEFPSGDNVIAYGSENGDPNMFTRGQNLYVWLGKTQQLFTFSFDCKLLNVRSLAFPFRDLADQNGFNLAQVVGLSVAGDGSIVAQLRLWTKDKNPDKTVAGLVKVAPDRQTVSLISSLSHLMPQGRFLGLSSDDRMIFQVPDDHASTTSILAVELGSTQQ